MVEQTNFPWVPVDLLRREGVRLITAGISTSTVLTAYAALFGKACPFYLKEEFLISTGEVCHYVYISLDVYVSGHGSDRSSGPI